MEGTERTLWRIQMIYVLTINMESTVLDMDMDMSYLELRNFRIVISLFLKSFEGV